MNKKTRILSLILALALVFGCLPLAAFAAPTELGGGVITDEDIEAGNADRLASGIPEANGIMTAAELKALGINVCAENSCNGKHTDTHGFQTVVTEENVENPRTYVKVGPATKAFACGEKPEFFLQLNSSYTHTHDNIKNKINGNKDNNYTSTIESYMGKAIVISVDVRLNEEYNLGRKALFDVRSYFAVDSKGSPTNVSFVPVRIEKGGVLTAGGVTLEAKVNATGTGAFTNVAVHIIPEKDTFDVYVDGVCQTAGMNLKFSSTSSSISALTFQNQTFGAANNSVSSEGVSDFVYSWTRFFHTYATYHGENCLRENDACTDPHHTAECSEDCTTQHNHLDACVVFCQESHTHTASCTVACTKAVTENGAPFNIKADQFALDNMKAYYSDIFLECTSHSIVTGSHTHDTENVTSSAVFECSNCRAEWTATVPMDQTGNALCDLCEIDNKNDDSANNPYHTPDEIKALVTKASGAFSMKNDSEKFWNGPAPTTDKNGNRYFSIGSETTEIFQDITVGTTNSAENAKKALTDPTYVSQKGQSLVLQADARLGADFYTEKKPIDLFIIRSNVNPAFSAWMINLAMINSEGKVVVRDGKSGGWATVATLSRDEFTSIALHIKTGAVKDINPCGLIDVYINGELVKTLQFLTESEVSEKLGFEFTYGNVTYKLQGISDYCYAMTRTFCTYTPNRYTNEDVFHADNIMNYFAEEYIDDFTRHDFKTDSHAHDYSQKCIEYGTVCEHCSAGTGGYAVLDANGDKLCDLCIAQKADFKANGTLEATEITALGLVLATQNNGSSKGTNYFNSTYATASVIKDGNVTTEGEGFQSIITEGGRTYIQIHGYKGTPECGKSSETYIQTGSGKVGSFDGLKARLADGTLDSYKGKSFVISLDLRLDKNYNYTTGIVDFRSYHAIRPSDGKMDPMSRSPLTVDKDGFLYADGTKLSAKVNKSTADTVADFTNIAIHAFPKENKYSVYVDGVWQIEKTLFTEDQIKNYLTFDLQKDPETDKVINVLTGKECSNGIAGLKSNGAEDYIFSWGRHFTIYGTAYHSGSCCDKAATTSSRIYAMTGEQASLDNLKTYYSDEYVECASHSYSLKGHTHDTETDELVATLECVCGKCSEIRLPIDTTGDNKCDSCGNYVLSSGALVTGRQVVLGDLISLKLYASIGSALATDPTAKVILTAGDKREEFILSEMSAEANGEYMFEIKLSAIELASDVSLTVEALGESGNAYVTSVRDYAMWLISSTEDEYEREICRAMLNYGAYAQSYFAGKNGTSVTDGELANALLGEADKALGNVSADTLSDYIIATEGEDNGTVFTYAILVLDSKISMKLYFTAKIGATVKLDGKDVTPSEEDGSLCIRIDGLLPTELDETHVISVTTEGKPLNVSVSVLTAIHALLISEDSSDSFKKLGQALYLYSLASDMYTAAKANDSARVVVKDDAKGTAALVFDDGNTAAANYIAGYMNEYTDVDVSFALNTRNYASFVKDSDGNYVMDENGKFAYTQTTEQQNNTQYWLEYGDRTDKNGNTIESRIDYVSHSHTHALPANEADYVAEFLGARHVIQGLFGYDTPSLVTPGGFTKPDAYNKVKESLHLVCRATSGSTNAAAMVATLDKFLTSRAMLPAFMVTYQKAWLDSSGAFGSATMTADEAIRANADGKADVSHVEAFIDAAMQSGGLAAFCFHGIVDKSYNGGANDGNGLHVYDEQADAIFAYVQKHAETGELWSASFTEATVYYSEWSTSELDTRELSDSKLAISLTDAEDDAVCNMRLTVKVSVSDAWTGATLTQGDYTEEVTVKGEAGAKYVLVNILPDGGIATLSAN